MRADKRGHSPYAREPSRDAPQAHGRSHAISMWNLNVGIWISAVLVSVLRAARVEGACFVRSRLPGRAFVIRSDYVALQAMSAERVRQ